MKKIFALFLCIFYILSTNACYAFNSLYYLKKADKLAISTQVDMILLDEKYDIKSRNPFYATSKKKPENYVVIVLQQSGENLFYFYESNDKNKKLNKTFLKAFKNRNIEYLQSEDIDHIASFEKIAQRAMTGEKKTYSFQPPQQNIQPQPKAKAEEKVPPTTLKGFVGKIGSGKRLDVYLQTAINTATAKQGDSITAVLKNDWIYKDCLVAPKGSIVYGTLTKASPAKLGSRNGAVQIAFNKIVLPNSKTLDISTQKIDFNVTNEGKVEKLLTSAVVGAAVGALVGLGIAALTCDSSNLARGAILGASIGGGSALITNTAQKGIDAEIPSYTDIEIVTDKPVNVVLSY